MCNQPDILFFVWRVQIALPFVEALAMRVSIIAYTYFVHIQLTHRVQMVAACLSSYPLDRLIWPFGKLHHHYRRPLQSTILLPVCRGSNIILIKARHPRVTCQVQMRNPAALAQYSSIFPLLFFNSI